MQVRKQTANALIKVLENQAPDASLFYRHTQLGFANTSNSLMHSIQSSYPVLIDEGSLVRFNPTFLLYSLATGKKKERLNGSSETQESIHFKTSIFIPSKKSLISMSDSNSGLIVRNLELMGMKFTSSAESADRIKATIRQNYDWAIQNGNTAAGQ